MSPPLYLTLLAILPIFMVAGAIILLSSAVHRCAEQFERLSLTLEKSRVMQEKSSSRVDLWD